MSITDDFYKGLEKRKKKKDEVIETTTGNITASDDFTRDFLNGLEKRRQQAQSDDDIAPVLTMPKRNSTKGSLFDDGYQFGDIIGTIRRGLGKEEKDSSESQAGGWFQGGAFDDGYQFGDLTKSMVATSDDFKENITSGILGIGEKTIDAAAYLVGGVGGLLGADDFKDDVSDFIAKDLIDEKAIAKRGINLEDIIAYIIGADTETDSFLAEKSDSLVQSGGQLAGTLLLQSVGVPWFVTSGVTSFGGEAEQAFNEGATYEEAGLSAAISAGAEILTEKLFGGSGLGEKGLINLEPLTKGISSKLVKALADYGLDIAAEGAEEVISEIAGNLGSALYKEENIGEILLSEEAVQGYIDAFVGGAVLGGVMNAGKVYDSIKTGKDYRTDLTTTEQKVFDKVYNYLVAEAEKNGKLTKKKKAEIYDEVLSKMEKGYIDIDTIEEALGGDTYKSYQDTIASEDSIQKEFDTLNKMKQIDMTGEQIDRRNELKQMLQDIKDNSKRNQLKQQLGDEVFGLVNGTRLAESYNERARRSQTFEADLSKYDSKQQAVIQKAIDSGVLNNTNRTHEFVDLVAKISADKGVLFDFTNNEKLKESGFAVYGKTVNGYVTKDGVTLNIHSAKALNSVVGHEITHVLEGTELYDALQKSIVEYAKSKGDYQGRYDALQKMYANIKDANIDNELTADLVGDYLFTDENFIRSLSTQNRNVFQKIYDEIKYLCRVATAGSKEARELEKVKRAFEKAYKEYGNVSEEAFYDSAAKYSLRVTDPEIKEFLDSQETITTYKTMQLVDGKLYPPMASRIDGKYEDYSVLGEWEQATEHPELIKDGNKFKLDKGKGNGSIEAAYNPYMHSSNLVLNDQFSGAYKRNNLVTVECEVPVSEATSGYQAEFAKDAVGWHPWHTGTVAGQLRQANGTERQVFLSRWIKPVRIVPDAEVASMYKSLLDGTGVEVPDNVVTPSLLQELKNAGVKIKESGRVKYSISDSDGNHLSKGQQANTGFSSAEIQTIQSIGRKSINDFNSQDIAATEKFARRYWEEMGLKSPFYRAWFGDWRSKDATPVQVATKRGDSRTDHVNKDTGWTIRNSMMVHNETTSHKSVMNREAVPYLPYIDDIIENAVLLDTKGIGKAKSENSLLMHYLYAVADIGNGAEVLKLTVEEMYNPGTKGTNKRAYTLQNIEKAFAASGMVQGKSPSHVTNTANAMNTVADLFSLVKRMDKNFAPSDSSKIINADGTPKVMYHGSPAQFTVFAKKKAKSSGQYGKGFYFTDSASHAGTYGNQYAVYLNIRNPLQSGADTVSRDQVRRYLEAVAENEDYSIENYGTYDIDSILNNVMGKYSYADAFKIINDINATAIGNMVEAAELFNSVNGTSFDGIVVPTETVAFYPEQIKSATDNIGTFDKSNPDIRFSLSEPVEQTNDLMALHNLKSNELLKSLELGGLPSPSIAIIKAQQGHDKYGEISLIFPKESIDPKASRYNKVYGGDAWTPTYPKIEYKPNAEVENRVRNKYYELAKTIGYDNARPLYNYVYEMENALNRVGGESGLLESLYEDTDMMQVYLQDSGKDKVEPVVKETTTKISDADAEMNQFMVDALGVDMLSEFAAKPGENPILHRKAFIEQHEDDILAAYERLCKEVYGFTDAETNNVLEQTDRKDLMRFIRNAYMYTKNNGVTVKTEMDYAATKEAIRSAAQEGYKEWVDNLFGGVEEKSGIRNNVDYYTPSGNHRKWEALHWENTLENVVNVMRQQNQTGADAMFGVNQVFSVAAKDYRSIAEIKADSDRLYTQNADEYEAAKESYVARFTEIAEKIMDKRTSNEFVAIENSMECIVDAVRSNKTADGIFKDLKQYPQLTVTQKDVSNIVSLVTDISNMPTGYFEAKPMRAVGFDEVAVFVIPYDADVKLKQELLNRGYSIAEYDPNVEGDRQRVVNQFEQYKFSLSDVGAPQSEYNKYMEYSPVVQNPYTETGTDAEYAPVDESSVTEVTDETEMFTDDLAPIYSELDRLTQTKEELEDVMRDMAAGDDFSKFDEVMEEYSDVMERLSALEEEAKIADAERMESLTNEEAPPEVEAPYYADDNVTVDNPFAERDWYSVGKRNVKAYMYENPEVKPFFQDEALNLMGELNDTIRGERWYNDELYYESGGEKGFGGTKRHTSKSIETLLDEWNMSYADIEKGLNAIIEDNGAENIAAAKKLEFMLNDRLLHGYKDFYSNGMIPPNQDYINMLNEKQINSYSKEAFDALMANADQYLQEDIAPVSQIPVKETANVSQAPVKETANVKKAPSAPPKSVKNQEAKQSKTAKVLTEEPKVEKKGRLGMMLRKNLVDDLSVFEDLSIKTNNRELQAKASFMRSAENRAQWMIGNGTQGVKSLNDIKTEVEATGDTQQFYEYLYHAHNVDRMSLETEENRIKREGLQKQFKGYKRDQIEAIAMEWITKDTPKDVKERIKSARAYIEALHGANKPVFSYDVTADVSREAVKRYEAANPEFKVYAGDVYKYMEHLRNLLVENNVISKETAELWQKMYPHYVPIRRITENGLNINVPLDSRKTGVNAPVKRAKGGNSDILPLFDTMAMRTEQTFRAIARNNFGLELKNTLGTVIGSEEVSNGIDETFEGIDSHEELLKKGKDGEKPTFTIFENGKRVTFEITEDMYDALKPKSEGLSYKNKVLGKLSDVQRGLLTQYSPMFILKNAIKDPQDALINSQHPVKTFGNFPLAYKEILGKGKWYTEYVESGGEHNTYFDRQTNKFTENVGGVNRVITMPLRAIDSVSNVVEMAPRLAEYIASRKEGRSIEVSMLDAARVTTDFAAGGDVTKFLNRNGATFLNASVQGAAQQVRNIREANAQGMKGWTKLAAKTIIAGIPALILNNLLWDDDDEYDELSDYVKRDYYVVGKLDDGTFIRIPKGRTVSVIQNAFEQISNVATGDDEADFGAFFELVISNLAPNNPLDNNIFAPLIQTFGTEKTWYGEDLIPSRLQDLPAAEQYDESTDAFSKWLGEKLNVSPYKINYLLNQYSGGIGDVIMPMLTPEAEGGDDTFLGNMIAPFKDIFTTNGTMNNQNVSDFYSVMDELKVNSNSMNATDEDLLKYKYMSAVNSELSELYQQKREIQNSDLSDSEKYDQVMEIQEKIVDIMREGLDNYDSVRIQGGNYAEIGGYHFDKDDDGKWWKINEEQLEKQQEVTAALGITPSEYWSNRTEYNFAYEKPEQYALSQAVGGYDAYKTYTSELWDISADKDENGKSIPYSRKEKVIDYINNLDVDYGMKIILFKNEYNADDTYNYEIIDYLNSRDDISYEQMETILKYLGFEVDKKGNITWD